jgi:hypothetical protein
LNKLENYDFNVYGDSDNSITLTAYPLVITYDEAYDHNRKIDCDYSERSSHSLRLTYPKHQKEIEHLLGDLWLNEYPFTDYDNWIGETELQQQHPQLIQAFLDLLPENKLEIEEEK